MNLKDGAIYQLPNGRELVAWRNGYETLLFSVSATKSGLYKLNSDGRLLCDGHLTAWQIDDLLETGRTAAPELAAQLAEGSPADRETTNKQII